MHRPLPLGQIPLSHPQQPILPLPPVIQPPPPSPLPVADAPLACQAPSLNKGKIIDLSSMISPEEGPVNGDSDMESYEDALQQAEMYRLLTGFEQGGPSQPAIPPSPPHTLTTQGDEDVFQDTFTGFSDSDNEPLLQRAHRLGLINHPSTQPHTPSPPKHTQNTTILTPSRKVHSVPIPARKKTVTWGQKLADSHKKTHSWGCTAIRPRAAGVGLRLRTVQQRIGMGSSPAKAIVIPDDDTSLLQTPMPAAEHKQTALPGAKPRGSTRKAAPRRSLRMIAQGEQNSTMTKAVKRKETTSSVSGISLITSFPYRRLTLEQIEALFQVYQLNLGHTLEERQTIIKLIQTMHRADFEKAIKALLARDTSQPIGEFLVQFNAQLTDQNRDTTRSL